MFVSSHLYRVAVGLVRDEADVLAGFQVLVKDNSVVVVDEVRDGSEDFRLISATWNVQFSFFPSSVSKWRSVSPSFLMRFAVAET